MELSGKLSNWSSFALFVLVLLGGLLAGDRKVQAMESAIKEQAKKNDEQDQIIKTLAAQQQVMLTQQAQFGGMVESIYKRGLIVQGKALVLDVGEEPYVELNTFDPNGPTRLNAFQQVNLYNLTHPDMILVKDVDIGASMSNQTPGYVMNLSKAAGELLHARPGTWIEIRATPVFEEVK